MAFPSGSGSGWGLSRWGFSAGWGDGFFGTPVGPVTILALSPVYAVGRRQVHVAMNIAPLMVSGFGPFDALNPNNWAVRRLDTNEQLVVGGVTQLDSQTVVLFMLTPLGGPTIQHRITASGMKTTGGASMSSASADFLGIATSGAPAGLRQDRPVTRDLLAVPVGDAVENSTIVIGATGDYEVESGVELLKKLIVRRLTTPPGAFRHLPDYGVGLAVKEPLPTGNLAALKAEIESQVRREPDVEAVTAGLSLGSNGVLVVTLKVRTSTGQRVDLSLAPQQPNVVL